MSQKMRATYVATLEDALEDIHLQMRLQQDRIYTAGRLGCYDNCRTPD